MTESCNICGWQCALCSGPVIFGMFEASLGDFGAFKSIPFLYAASISLGGVLGMTEILLTGTLSFNSSKASCNLPIAAECNFPLINLTSLLV